MVLVYSLLSLDKKGLEMRVGEGERESRRSTTLKIEHGVGEGTYLWGWREPS